MHVTAGQVPRIRLQPQPMRWFLDVERAARNRADEMARLLPFGAAYAVLHGVLVAGGLLITTAPDVAAAIWPAVGMLCAVLASTPRRTWPLWIVCSIVGRVLADLLILDRQSLISPLAFSLVNVVEALTFALLMQKPLVQSFNQGRPLYLSTAIIFASAVVANIGGILGAGVLQLFDFNTIDFLFFWRIWAAADFIGLILVAPLAIWIMLPQVRVRRELAGEAERVGMLAALAIALALAVYLAQPYPSNYAGVANVVLATLLALPILWASLRADFSLVALLQIVLALTVIMTSAYGLGPFAHDLDGFLPALAGMQVFLITAFLILTTLSFAILERHNAQLETAEHQRFSDLMVNLTRALIEAGTQNLDRAISNSLKLIGEFAGADRCVLLETDEQNRCVLATHRWAADEHIEESRGVLQASLDKIPELTARLEDRGYLILHHFDRTLPPGAEELDAMRQAIPNSLSVLYVGLFDDDRLIGAVGYGYTKGNERWSSQTIYLMYLAAQLFANMLRRKRAEHETELYRDKLRSLAQAMSVTEERARRQAALDLHDSIGQNLAVARMKVGQLLAQHSGLSEVIQLRKLIDDALRGTRYIISDLSPSILYELGLFPALESLAERFSLAHGIVCNVAESGLAWQPDNDLRITLYRAVQECLANIARHARAENALIRIFWTEQVVDIEIVDDGIGFDANASSDFLPHAKGFGLFSMRESIARRGGHVEIESASGIGTTVRICVPQHTPHDVP